MKKSIYTAGFALIISFTPFVPASAADLSSADISAACFETQLECVAACDSGSCTQSSSNCYLCRLKFTSNDSLITDEFLAIDDDTPSKTVSVCPAGTTKSSDGCCCVND